MTEAELMALVEILNRAPVSQAEKLFLQALINRLGAKLPSTHTEKSHETEE